MRPRKRSLASACGATVHGVGGADGRPPRDDTRRHDGPHEPHRSQRSVASSATAGSSRVPGPSSPRSLRWRANRRGSSATPGVGRAGEDTELSTQTSPSLSSPMPSSLWRNEIHGSRDGLGRGRWTAPGRGITGVAIDAARRGGAGHPGGAGKSILMSSRTPSQPDPSSTNVERSPSCAASQRWTAQARAAPREARRSPAEGVCANRGKSAKTDQEWRNPRTTRA